MKLMSKVLMLIKINLQKNMVYRSSFFISSISSLIWLLIPIIMFKYVYLNVDSIGGWTWSDTIILLGVYQVIDSVMMGLLINSMGNLENDMVDGGLDRRLSYPMNTRVYYIFSDINLGQLINSVFGIVMITYGYLIGDYDFTLLNLLLFIVFIFIGIIIYYHIWFIMVVTTFWWPASRSRGELFTNLIEIGRYPVTIFDGIGKVVFKYIIPLSLICNPAAAALTGNGNLYLYSATIIMVSILGVLSSYLWKKGLEYYQGSNA